MRGTSAPSGHSDKIFAYIGSQHPYYIVAGLCICSFALASRRPRAREVTKEFMERAWFRVYFFDHLCLT